MWLSRIDVVHARDGRRVGARAGEQPVARDDLVDRRRRAERARVREDHEVVADALEVGDDVRREHDGDPVSLDRLHHRVQELAARERVERRHRLVEQQQLGPLRERERQRDLRLLAARELADLAVEREPEPLDPRARERRRPSVGLSLRPSFSVSRDGEAAVQRMVLRDEPDAAAAARPRRARGTRPSTATSPASAAPRPTASCSSVVLPAPFGPTSAVTEPAGISSVQSRSAQVEP